MFQGAKYVGEMCVPNKKISLASLPSTPICLAGPSRSSRPRPSSVDADHQQSRCFGCSSRDSAPESKAIANNSVNLITGYVVRAE